MFTLPVSAHRACRSCTSECSGPATPPGTRRGKGRWPRLLTPFSTSGLTPVRRNAHEETLVDFALSLPLCARTCSERRRACSLNRFRFSVSSLFYRAPPPIHSSTYPSCRHLLTHEAVCSTGCRVLFLAIATRGPCRGLHTERETRSAVSHTARCTGCRMIEMSCEEHDSHAASSQFMAHTTGRLLAELGPVRHGS